MSPYNILLEDDEPKSLGDWVKNFRVKKVQMKRKYRGGGDLRICAILTTALLNAEHELRRKQQERFSRWLDIQTKFQKDIEINRNTVAASAAASPIRTCASEANIVTSFSNGYDNREEDLNKQRNEDINDLWRSELNSLDEFMRNISGKTQYNISSAREETTNIQNGGANTSDINSFNINSFESTSLRESTSLTAAAAS